MIVLIAAGAMLISFVIRSHRFTTLAKLVIIFDSHGGEPLEAMNSLEAR